MAADKKYKFSGMNSKKTVETCQNCKGAPELEEFHVDGCSGNMCAFPGCMIVVNWWKTGDKIKVKQKVTISSTAPADTNTEVTGEFTPGNKSNQLSFDDLKTQ